MEDVGTCPAALAPDRPRPGINMAAGTAASYLLASREPGAGGGGVQPVAGELPQGGHGAGTDVALRVTQELLGERGHLGSQERVAEAGLSWGPEQPRQL